MISIRRCTGIWRRCSPFLKPLRRQPCRTAYSASFGDPRPVVRRMGREQPVSRKRLRPAAISVSAEHNKDQPKARRPLHNVLCHPAHYRHEFHVCFPSELLNAAAPASYTAPGPLCVCGSRVINLNIAASSIFPITHGKYQMVMDWHGNCLPSSQTPAFCRKDTDWGNRPCLLSLRSL